MRLSLPLSLTPGFYPPQNPLRSWGRRVNRAWTLEARPWGASPGKPEAWKVGPSPVLPQTQRSGSPSPSSLKLRTPAVLPSLPSDPKFQVPSRLFFQIQESWSPAGPSLRTSNLDPELPPSSDLQVRGPCPLLPRGPEAHYSGSTPQRHQRNNLRQRVLD